MDSHLQKLQAEKIKFPVVLLRIYLLFSSFSALLESPRTITISESSNESPHGYIILEIAAGG